MDENLFYKLFRWMFPIKKEEEKKKVVVIVRDYKGRQWYVNRVQTSNKHAKIKDSKTITTATEIQKIILPEQYRLLMSMRIDKVILYHVEIEPALMQVLLSRFSGEPNIVEIWN